MTRINKAATLKRHFSGFAAGKIAFPLRESKRKMMQFGYNSQQLAAVLLSKPGG